MSAASEEEGDWVLEEGGEKLTLPFMNTCRHLFFNSGESFGSVEERLHGALKVCFRDSQKQRQRHKS